MSDRKAVQLRIPFKEPAVFADSYWIRLSQEEPENETVTFTEAAKVIDNLFDIDPCMDSNFEIGGVPIQIDEENIDAKLKESFSLIEYDPCKFISTDRDFIANIFVFRSHIEENYVLRLTNGKVLDTEKVTFLVDTFEEVKDEKHIPLDYSIVRDLECSEEVESYSGSTITLKEKATGFVRVTFITEYDKVQIKVFGKGLHEDPVGCKCIAFYKGVVSDIYVDPPYVDVLAVEKIGCYSDREEDEEEEEEVIPLDPCYRRVIVQQKCQCSEEQKDSWDYVELIPCPPPGNMLSGNVTEESAYEFWWENRKVIIRVACGEKDDVADKEFFKEKCCKYPENMDPKVGLPSCEVHKRTWFGPVGIKNGPEYYKALHGQKLSLIPVRPKNSTYSGLDKFICGEVITEQQVNALNCCDPEITPEIIYNEEDSAEIIADNSSGLIFWEGGVPPFDLKINGQGFYLDNNHMFKSVTISSPGWSVIDDVGYWSHRVYTEDSCGPASIIITDGCTTATGGLRSTEGQWVKTKSDHCESSGVYADEVISDGNDVWIMYAYLGSLKRMYQRSAYDLGNQGTSKNQPCGRYDDWRTIPYNYINSRGNMCVYFDQYTVGRIIDNFDRPPGFDDEEGSTWFVLRDNGKCAYGTREKTYGTPSLEEWRC